MTITSIAKKLSISENTLYRYRSGRHCPHKKVLIQMRDSGVDMVQFLQPYFDSFGIEVKNKE